MKNTPMNPLPVLAFFTNWSMNMGGSCTTKSGGEYEKWVTGSRLFAIGDVPIPRA
jgi:hypothetical protein